MSLIEIFLIALGLAMDCFAVSVASGVTAKGINAKDSLKMATSFGLFQALMPIIGWMAGVSMQNFIHGVDHWIAFTLLAFVGLKMIISSFGQEKEGNSGPSFTPYALLILSIATSIDALAVGLSFGLLKTPIVFPIIVIGLVSFLVTLLGVWLGKKSGHFFERKLEILGGLILIGIGIKIVFEHIYKHI